MLLRKFQCVYPITFKPFEVLLLNCIQILKMIRRCAENKVLNSPTLLTELFPFISPSSGLKRAVVIYWQKYVHEALVNRLGGLSLPRKSVVRLSDCFNMTLAVYRGRKTTTTSLFVNFSVKIVSAQ